MGKDGEDVLPGVVGLPMDLVPVVPSHDGRKEFVAVNQQFALGRISEGE
jgi:hypothetical protein